MKQRRLRWLAAVAGVLAVLRLVVPSPSADTPRATAQAIVRTPASRAMSTTAPAAASTSTAPAAASIDTPDVPGDAFAARPAQAVLAPPAPPPAPPPAIVAAAPIAQAPVVEPVPVPPPMPFRVIGTWDDGDQHGVFLAGPHGAVLARPGTTLQGEFEVTEVTPRQISLLHLATRQALRLAIPLPPETPRPLP